MRLAFLLTLLLTVGCDAADDGLLPVEGDLVVTLPPTYDVAPAGPPSSVVVQTTGMYPCLGYELVLEATAGSGRADIEVDGARAPAGICLTALGPASATVSLPADVRGGYLIRLSGPNGRFSAYELTEVEGQFALTLVVSS